MKRSPLPPRKAYIARSKKPIARMNLRQARRKADKYQAHLRSAHFRWVKEQVRKRSEGRCERLRHIRFPSGEIKLMRCPNDGRVFNHTSYAKVPHEPPEHVEHLCEGCNGEYEGSRPWRASRRRYLATVEGKR